MKPISVEHIENIWQKVNELSEIEAEGLVNELGESHPFLLAYLVGTGNEDFNEDEGEFLLYVGVVLWEIFRQATKEINEITEETVAKVEHTNIKMLEYLETESESYFFEFVENLVKDYLQPNVLQFITELTFDQEEDIRDQNRGMMFIYLKIVADCLHKSAS